MEWGILLIVIILLLVSYVIIQETRAQLHWRGLVEQGDVEAIRRLLQEEVDSWHMSRVPRGVPTMLWHGIQTVELSDVTATGARVECSAEGEYSLAGGRRIETSSALAEGMKITMKLAEMLFYDVPNVKLAHAQIDVYTSFRDSAGHAEPQCILSSRIERATVEHLDWEATPAPEFIELVDGRFDADASGTIQPVEPIFWQGEPPKIETAENDPLLEPQGKALREPQDKAQPGQDVI